MKKRKLILFEANEIPWRIVDYYCAQHDYQNPFGRLLKNSTQYTTKTDDTGELHPWVTWPTLHRGVSNEQHRLKDVSENLLVLDKKFPPIWQILVQQGISCGIFSSLHTFPLPTGIEDYCFFVPDPFAVGSDTHPRSIQPFQNFNLRMSRKSGRNVDSGIDKNAALDLLLSLPTLGIKTKTITSIVKQLISERVSPWKTSRRRIFQSVLAFDIYMKLLRKHKPDFTTFFTNHVASVMHRFWAASFPNDYTHNSLPEEWINRYKNEISVAMTVIDESLTVILNFISKNPEYRLILASSMGQEASKADLISTELILEEPEKFMNFLKIPIDNFNILPAMHPQYNFRISKKEHHTLTKSLENFSIADKPLSFRKKDVDFFSIDLGHQNLEVENAIHNGTKVDLRDLGMVNKKIDDQSGGTAYHIPEGILAIFDPNAKGKDQQRSVVNTKSIAPSIIKSFGIEPPSYMTKDIFHF